MGFPGSVGSKKGSSPPMSGYGWEEEEEEDGNLDICCVT